jgi:hypothetical protein
LWVGGQSGLYSETLPQENNNKQNGKDLSRHFLKEDIQMANWFIKRCSTILII